MPFPAPAPEFTEAMRRALAIVKDNPGADDLTARGHAVLNAGVPGLLRLGLIEYAPGWRVGYRLTYAGKATL